MATKPYHKVWHPLISGLLSGMVNPPLLWVAYSNLNHPLGEKIFLICNPNLPWHNLRLFHLVLSLHAWRRDWPSSCHSLLSDNCRAIGSPLSLLFFRLDNHSSLSHSLWDLCSGPFTSSVALFGHTQCLSCSEGPRTEHWIQGEASPVPTAGGQSLSWSCWPDHCWHRPGCHQPPWTPGLTLAHVQFL